MKITEVTTAQLRRALVATEQAVGGDSTAARMIRRELERRDRERRTRKPEKGGRR